MNEARSFEFTTPSELTSPVRSAVTISEESPVEYSAVIVVSPSGSISAVADFIIVPSLSFQPAKVYPSAATAETVTG